MAKRSMPSLAALLGLVAVVGYQHRDKIGDFVKNIGGSAGAGSPIGDAINKAKEAVGGVDSSSLPGGLGDLVDRFKKNGLGEKADSWVGTGHNQPVTEQQVEQGVGSDLIGDLAKQTGLSREELLKRLSAVLPEAVDKMTPGGQLPS